MKTKILLFISFCVIFQSQIAASYTLDCNTGERIGPGYCIMTIAPSKEPYDSRCVNYCRLTHRRGCCQGTTCYCI
ncbi:hypothetical protein O3M35_006985 [Rhynocoris fuscipes]|uniref:Uncharacterized protein n=1 Tax=Rhynocoris fuscipes TaxID=488301 RepID=A0AAW1DFY3_9HEMI